MGQNSSSPSRSRSRGDLSTPTPSREQSREPSPAPQPRFENEWDLGHKIGQGTYGKVYMCESKTTGVKAAVKIVHLRRLHRSTRRHLEDEVRILGELSHGNIIKLYDVYQNDRDVYIVQELCTGGQLFDRIIERHRYDENDARELVRRMLDAVAYAHSKGIVHRDIKPENVLLYTKDSDVEIKLADWGMARHFEGLNPMKTICGTPSYMAPELLEVDGARQSMGYDQKSDIWSIGVIMYILLAGHNPFDDDSFFDIVAKIRACWVKYPHKYFSRVSDEAKDLLRNILVKEPSKRMSARECLEHKWFAVCHTKLTVNELVDTRQRIAAQKGHCTLKTVANAVLMANRISINLTGRYLNGDELHSSQNSLSSRRGSSPDLRGLAPGEGSTTTCTCTSNRASPELRGHVNGGEGPVTGVAVKGFATCGEQRSWGEISEVAEEDLVPVDMGVPLTIDSPLPSPVTVPCEHAHEYGHAVKEKARDKDEEGATDKAAKDLHAHTHTQVPNAPQEPHGLPPLPPATHHTHIHAHGHTQHAHAPQHLLGKKMALDGPPAHDNVASGMVPSTSSSSLASSSSPPSPCPSPSPRHSTKSPRPAVVVVTPLPQKA